MRKEDLIKQKAEKRRKKHNDFFNACSVIANESVGAARQNRSLRSEWNFPNVKSLEKQAGGIVGHDAMRTTPVFFFIRGSWAPQAEPCNFQSN